MRFPMGVFMALGKPAEKLDKLKELFKQLNLTPEQKDKLLPILRAKL